MGLSPFGNPLSVYNSKVLELEEKKSVATKLGTFLEPAILAYTADKLKAQGVEADVVYKHPNGIMVANCDGLFQQHFFRKLKDEPWLVEVKTTGFTGTPPEADDWGKGGTDQIPPRVLVQVHHQMACSGIGNALVPLLSGHDGKGLRIYRISRSDLYVDAIEKISTFFWKNHVEPRIPPAEDLKRIIPVKLQHGPTQDDPGDSVSGW